MLGDHPVHPVLQAKDLAAAREFYHDKVGLEILMENDDLPGLETADGIADIGFALFAWNIDPGKNALGIMQLKGLSLIHI